MDDFKSAVKESFENYLCILDSGTKTGSWREYIEEDGFTFLDIKKMWLLCGVFGHSVDDSGMELIFANELFEVLNAILDRTTFEFIKDETNYKNFCMWTMLLGGYLDCGTSIRGSWFSFYSNDTIEENVPFTEESMKYILKEFIPNGGEEYEKSGTDGKI